MSITNLKIPYKVSPPLVAVLALVASPTYGQALEEIIVTAQKRVESAQEIPLTVAVVSGETLDQFSINNATDLANSVPGLEISPAPQGLSSPKIRGLGTGVGAENMEQSVGLFLDGVWTGKTRDLQSALFDVGRIEVIKGTQTSQLGKNTSLGAIMVMSKRPEDENGGFAQAEYDFELGSTILSGAGNIATDFGNYRLAVNLVQEEGFVENQRVGGDDPEREQNSVRISGLWNPGDRATIYASYTYDDRDVTGMSFEVSEDPTGWYEGLTGDTDTSLNNKRKTWTSYASDGKDFDEQEGHRAVLEFAYDVNDSLDFTSLTGYSEYDNTRFFDADFSTLDYLEQYKETEFDQFSQEFRLNGTAFDEVLDYVAGFYYMENHFESYQHTNFMDTGVFIPVPVAPGIYAATGPASGPSQYEQDIETWSVYGNGAFQLGDRWRLTLGIRYTDETKDLENWSSIYDEDESSFYFGLDPENGVFLPIPPAALPPGAPATFYEIVSAPFESTDLPWDEDNIDGSINLQYQFDSGNVYASWARGSKSGGYSTSAGPDADPFDTEEAETVELGFKSELLDGELRLNAALFHTEIDNFQSVQFVGTGFQSSAIPVETQGFEFESLWAATANLTMGLAATYADAERTDTGFTPAGAPEWTASLSVDHGMDLGSNYELRTNALVNYSGEEFTQGMETYEAPSLVLVDLRVALSPINSQWELALMARNLLDEQKFVFGFPFPVLGATYGTSLGSLNRPRTVAIQARYNF
ncbi:TonB-dependent receptor [Halioglobus maricola]|nr:TonB-dependent receptor [Halioglobus maricola]